MIQFEGLETGEALCGRRKWVCSFRAWSQKLEASQRNFLLKGFLVLAHLEHISAPKVGKAISGLSYAVHQCHGDGWKKQQTILCVKAAVRTFLRIQRTDSKHGPLPECFRCAVTCAPCFNRFSAVFELLSSSSRHKQRKRTIGFNFEGR